MIMSEIQRRVASFFVSYIQHGGRWSVDRLFGRHDHVDAQKPDDVNAHDPHPLLGVSFKIRLSDFFMYIECLRVDDVEHEQQLRPCLLFLVFNAPMSIRNSESCSRK